MDPSTMLFLIALAYATSGIFLTLMQLRQRRAERKTQSD
jgi:hypothetical protein